MFCVLYGDVMMVSRQIQKLRNSTALYYKTKSPFEVRICMYSSFQLLYYFMNVKLRRFDNSLF